MKKRSRRWRKKEEKGKKEKREEEHRKGRYQETYRSIRRVSAELPLL